MYITNKRFIFPLQCIAESFKDLDLTFIEKIKAFSKAPWAFVTQIIISSQEDAITKAFKLDTSMPIVFIDRSAQNNLLGIRKYGKKALLWAVVLKIISTLTIVDL